LKGRQSLISKGKSRLTMGWSRRRYVARHGAGMDKMDGENAAPVKQAVS